MFLQAGNTQKNILFVVVLRKNPLATFLTMHKSQNKMRVVPDNTHNFCHFHALLQKLYAPLILQFTHSLI